MSNKTEPKTQDQDSDMKKNGDQTIMVICTVTVINPDGSLETKTGPFLRIIK
ncbi:MAG: hypothetical protein Q8T09_02745 [Candidatus Melainabacteria bacterium]|nr:hypothetical protein [Candidatus Melainabacteria bacterium]